MSRAVHVSDLAVSAAGKRILGPLDFELEEGEYVRLVGPSGSGKSTLLRALAGLAQLDSGRLALFGRDVVVDGRSVVTPAKREVGLVFQGAALWPHMSVEKTLRFTLSCHGVERSAQTARVTELLDDVQLAGYEKRMPGTLSGGEAQRLALARALASSPRLLLLDEPLGMLDMELRESLMETLSALHRSSGRTTIHVTHDPEEAQRIATRTLRLEAGALVSTTKEIG